MHRIVPVGSAITPGDPTHKHKGYLIGRSYGSLRRWNVPRYDIWRHEDDHVTLYADTLEEAIELIEEALGGEQTSEGGVK